FSKIAKPLTLLTQKNKTYVWCGKQDEAFRMLKEKLCNAPVLALPDGLNDYVVYCNASKQGFGCVLMQQGKVITDYECEIKYHSGKANVVADALSRKERLKPRRIPSVGGVRKLIMDEAHTSRYLIHSGANKMYYDLRDLYWWPGSGSLPSNTVANPKGELKAITTHSGLVTDGPTVPTSPKSITPEVDEHVEETYTDPDLAEYTIKVPPPPVQKYKPLSQREFVVHKRGPLHPNIPYPSRMLKQKQQKKDEVQMQNFWQMFKQLHINITLADALVLMLKYQKMLKALMSNKEKLQELANTPLNENCSAVILKKLPEKLGDPRKFLIPCGFSELKCKSLADLGASINLMPLSVRKKLGLPELIPTRMTLELLTVQFAHPLELQKMSSFRLASLHSQLILSLLIMRAILEFPLS
nr:reverse transcriptase domain-containing protein [Tanacetum cinerariifolium]